MTIKENSLKNPTKGEIIVAIILISAWVTAMLFYTDFNLERTGALSIGAIVGLIFSLFGYSATNGVKNTLVIVGVSFASTMVYNIVAQVIHTLT